MFEQNSIHPSDWILIWGCCPWKDTDPIAKYQIFASFANSDPTGSGRRKNRKKSIWMEVVWLCVCVGRGRGGVGFLEEIH